MNDEIYRGSSGDKRGGKCCNSHEKSPKWRRADKLSQWPPLHLIITTKSLRGFQFLQILL